MAYKPTLSDEEMACFSEVFSPIAAGNGSMVQHVLTVTTDVPQAVASILGQAKLTLLAEVSHYKLWFPLVMKIDELGQLTPTLGIPEVLDTQGAERSWRLTQADDLLVCDDELTQPMSVHSLSSSGMAIRTLSAKDSAMLMNAKTLQLQLPSGVLVPLEVEPIRSDDGVTVLKIRCAGSQSEALRQFLFNRHRKLFSHLYEELI